MKDFGNSEKKKGTLEIIDLKQGMIKYYMPLEKEIDFYLTKHAQPSVADDYKYTSLYYKKNE